ncbi:MAG: hypothetical protein ABSC95_18100 [Acetobacteraceae bacterium]|jgi:hypothetical protein
MRFHNIQENLAARDPGNRMWPGNLAESDIKIGIVLAQRGNIASAIDSLNKVRCRRHRVTDNLVR